MARRHLAQRRVLAGAPVQGHVTARPERAADGLAIQPRRRAGDGDHRSPSHTDPAWPRTAAGCRGGAGGGRASSIGPDSTISPAYMTAARSHTWATTGRSWVTSTRARPSSSDRPESSSRIWACTMTSSAVVGSSASSTFGWQASAIAMDARCRMPPENSCGYRSAAAAGMPTISSSSPARRRAPRPGRCRGRPSARRSASRPSSPGSGRSSRPGRPSRRPSSGMAAPSPRRRPGWYGRRCAPPRRPRRSAAAGPSAPGSRWSCRIRTRRPGRTARPRSRVKLTPDTACTCPPCGRSNQTCRSDTSSRLISRRAPFRPAGAAASGEARGARPSAGGSARPRPPGRTGSSPRSPRR